MAEYKYSISEKNDNPLESKIKKEGISVEFTLNQLIAEKQRADKLQKELEAQLKLEEAKAQNVADNYPFVKDVDEEEEKKAVAITLYKGTLSKIDEINNKLKQIADLNEEHFAELADIKEQTGIEEVIESPYE